ncbi:MAG: hypothetical protein HN742_00245 [Lentisphaerae bacterium]|jgi:alkaline phosphatase D|nr:hypothetical protein [Lentisphaerota bacterium]MBT4820491.1 hypothetical protein [Lentisphaerota bacterium]MBT5608773.1 hypothetical protein [Lentisphaerota bacterium]MBT7058284.1 hypothetical protein [Lentisphaerota bacterium]MBT7840259.1 hypothetical protein [Lentisphaerota bacterium]
MGTHKLRILSDFRAVSALAVFVAVGAFAQDGLLGHWPLDEAGGRVASGGGPSAVEASLHGTSWHGRKGKGALGFDGRAFVEFGDPDDGRFDLGARGDFAVSLWVCIANAPPDQFTLLGKGDRGANPKLLLKVLKDGRLLFRISAEGKTVDVNGRTSIADGKWHHVVAQADRDKETILFLDGRREGIAASTAGIAFANASSLVLGKSHQDGAGARRFLVGFLDDLRLYARCLRPPEVVVLASGVVDRPAVKPIEGRAAPSSGVRSSPRVFARPYETAPVAARWEMVTNGQGEMCGEVTPTSAIVQSRLTWGKAFIDGDLPGCPGTARFELSRDVVLAAPRLSPWLPARAEGDFIVKHRFTGLEPGTRYYYRVRFGLAQTPTKVGQRCTFRTLPGGKGKERVRIAVVTGMNYHRFYNGKVSMRAQGEDRELGYPALASMLALGPDYMVGTGDNVYYDTGFPARTQAGMRAKWHEQFCQPRFIDLLANVATYWEKDDHDYRYNDADTTGSRPPSHELGIATFLEQVPVVGPGTKAALTYRTYRMTRDLQVWFVEGRDFRSPNRAPVGAEKTLWGSAQMAWLKRTLLASDATFKLLVNPTPIVGPDRSSKIDNHANPRGFMHEGRAFIEWLVDHDFLKRGFYLVCGDRHWQYQSIDPSGVEEFSCGAFVDANAIVGTFPGHPKSNDPDGRITQPYHPRTASGGFLMVTSDPETEAAPPTLNISFYDEKGVLLHQVLKTGDQLK